MIFGFEISCLWGPYKKCYCKCMVLTLKLVPTNIKFFKLKNTKSGCESTCLPHAGVNLTFSHLVAPSPSMSSVRVPGAYGLMEGGEGQDLESTVHHGRTHNLLPQVCVVCWRRVCPAPFCTEQCLCGTHFPRPSGWLVTLWEHPQRVGRGPAWGTQGSPLTALARLRGKSCFWLLYSPTSAPLPFSLFPSPKGAWAPRKKKPEGGPWPFPYLANWEWGWGILGRQLNLKNIFYMKSLFQR